MTATDRLQSILWMRRVSQRSFSRPWPKVKLSPSVDLWLQHLTPGEGTEWVSELTNEEWMNDLPGIKLRTSHWMWTQKFFVQWLLSYQRAQQHKQVLSQWTSKGLDMPPTCLLSKYTFTHSSCMRYIWPFPHAFLTHSYPRKGLLFHKKCLGSYLILFLIHVRWESLVTSALLIINDKH